MNRHGSSGVTSSGASEEPHEKLPFPQQPALGAWKGKGYPTFFEFRPSNELDGPTAHVA
jgi:hypothetical protein